jgi:uncharacterized protein (DUF983 family)
MRSNYTQNWREILQAAICGLKLKCPSCKTSNIYNSPLNLKAKTKCRCGLDYQGFDTGDGPAYTAIFFVSFLIPILAIIFEVMYEPPFYVFAITIIPATLISSFLILKFSRSVYIAIEYKIRQLEKDDTIIR